MIGGRIKTSVEFGLTVLDAAYDFHTVDGLGMIFYLSFLDVKLYVLTYFMCHICVIKLELLLRRGGSCDTECATRGLYFGNISAQHVCIFLKIEGI